MLKLEVQELGFGVCFELCMELLQVFSDQQPVGVEYDAFLEFCLNFVDGGLASSSGSKVDLLRRFSSLVIEHRHASFMVMDSGWANNSFAFLQVLRAAATPLVDRDLVLHTRVDSNVFVNNFEFLWMEGNID